MSASVGRSSLNVYINRTLNGVGAVGKYVFNGGIAAPAVLGYIGGSLVG